MSDHMEHRVKVMEQKLLVMQKEVSEVIGELQQAMTALMRSQAMATAVANSRLEELEAKVPGLGLYEQFRKDEEGKEL